MVTDTPALFWATVKPLLLVMMVEMIVEVEEEMEEKEKLAGC